MEGRKRKPLRKQKNISEDDGIFMSSSNEDLSEKNDNLPKMQRRARPPKVKKRNILSKDSGFADASLSIDSVSKAELPSILQRPIDISRGSSVDPEDYCPKNTNDCENEIAVNNDIKNVETIKPKKANKLRRAYTAATTFMSGAWKSLDFGELLVGPDFPPMSHRGSYDLFVKKFSCDSGTNVDPVVPGVRGNDNCDLLGTSVDGGPEIFRSGSPVYEERGTKIGYNIVRIFWH